MERAKIEFDFESPDEADLHRKALQAEYEYSRYSALKELNLIREIVMDENN